MEKKAIKNADKKQLEEYAERYWKDSAPGELARMRLAKLRHEELLPKPWYRTGLGWIAFLTLIATLAGIVIAFVLKQ